MKTISLLITLLVTSSLVAYAQPTARQKESAPAYSVVERGPHHRVMQSVSWQTNVAGRISAKTNVYKELETAMHYFENGVWKETKAEIGLLAGGAAATNGPHKVFFAANLNSIGAIDLTTPDGKRLRSRVFGLSYFDSASGQAVLLAETKDSIGQLIYPNQVIYSDAFDEVSADVQYIYSKAGLEQNIVLRAQLPGPAEFSLNPETTRLQVLTEFYDSPAAERKPIATSATGLADETVDFGQMKMVRGRAFSVGDETARAKAVPVAKQWVVLSGRTFLVEEVPFKAVAAQLQALTKPKRTAGMNPRLQGKGESVTAALLSLLPKRMASRTGGVIRLAKLDPKKQPGFVLDYSIQSSATNFTFKGDTTYYVTNAVYLDGTTTIEGGAVVKFSTNSAAQIIVREDLVCQTGPYRPAVFTAKDDNSVGEAVAGSSGNPSGYYGNGLALGLADSVLKGIRMAYATTAVSFLDPSEGVSIAIENAQFLKCQVALHMLDAQTVTVRNALAYSIGTFFDEGNGARLFAEHLTINECHYLNQAKDGELYLTNSLLVAITNLSGTSYLMVTNSTTSLASGAGIFQTVGAGAHYLATGSPYRNAGTANINADLLASLSKKTTYPPLVISNCTIAADTNFSPQVQRDSDTPDLGYHYDPLDYLIGPTWITNSALTVEAGTVLGIYPYPYGYGIAFRSGARMICNGTATAPVIIAKVKTVQEGAITNQTALKDSIITSWTGVTTLPSASFRFTDFYTVGNEGIHFDGYSDATEPIDFWSCEFHGGGLRSLRPQLNLTNCLFERVVSVISDDYADLSPTVVNCLYVGGSLYLTHWDVGTWSFRNTLFDQTTIVQDGAIDHDYNGYITGSARLTPTNGTQDVVASLTYQTGPLGRYYQPPNSVLINAGSVTDASLVGLHHYTTTTNQVKETNSIVDIGYHYVAVTTNNLPVDTDGDGLPDYLADQDRDGDELLDGWEWKYFGSFAQNANGDYDGDGASNLAESNAGTDPNSISCLIFSPTKYVNVNNAPILIRSLSGVPNQQAFVVNSTNFTAATWSTFSSSNFVNLGSTDGRYDVWVSVRGRVATNNGGWERHTFFRDTVAPTLIVTNMTSTSPVPVIQLLGYSPERLETMSCDIFNATGDFTNHLCLVTEQFYDTNLMVFTTNWFQTYDAQLAEGTNVIVARATDKAGNVGSVTNTVVFSLSSDTNPPAITLYWPQNGELISGTNFTLRGWVDDATASVTAEIVDSTGTTNTVSGFAERNGLLWAEELPLNTGTNVVTLTVTDAATNVTTTNITVIKSSIELVISPLPVNDLPNGEIAVSGTINDTNYAVWVNGVRATSSGNAWSAADVPVNEGGTALVEARAIPNSDNAGIGSGPGTDRPSSANLQNPNSASASPATQAAETVQPHIRVKKYNYREMVHMMPPDDGPDFSDHEQKWRRTAASKHKKNTWTTLLSLVTDEKTSWPDPTKPGTTISWDSASNLTQTFTNIPPITTQNIHRDFHLKDALRGTDTTNKWDVDLDADIEFELVTGGKARSAKVNLFSVTASAGHMTDDLPPGYSRGDSTNILPTMITVLGKALGTNGIAYFEFPDNTIISFTVETPFRNYGFDVGQQKYLSHFEVFVCQPYPGRSYGGSTEPLLFPIWRSTVDAGHAWWKLTTEAPPEAINEFITGDCSQWLDVEVGYGPNGSLNWFYALLNDTSPTAPGLLPYPYSNASTTNKTYSIGFSDLKKGLKHTEVLHQTSGTYDLRHHNCVTETRQTGRDVGVTLPGGFLPQYFGENLPDDH